MIRYIEDIDEKKRITRQILDALPAWFGIKEAKQEYVEQSRDSAMFACLEGAVPIGFVSIKQHYRSSAEITVIGVKSDHQRCGIGRKLLEMCGKWCLEREISYLQVKTLSELSPDKNYAETRKFYEKMGFDPLETFPTLWDEANPCLVMVKYLNLART